MITTLLRPYFDLSSSDTMPLHAQAVAWQASGKFDAAYPSTGLLPMWMPPGYRQRVCSAAATRGRVGADEDTLVPVSFTSESAAGTTNACTAILLALLSEYDVLTEMPSEGNLIIELLQLRARRLLEPCGLWYIVESSLWRRLAMGEGTALSTHVVATLAVRELVDARRIQLARQTLLAEERAIEKRASVWPDWLVKICALRVICSHASIDYATGKEGIAIDRWMGAIEAADSETPDETVDWIYREFRRRRLERLAQNLLGLGWSMNVRSLAEAAVAIDPHDGRARLLHGDALLLTEPSEAANAYRKASHLDPTIAAEAAYRAARALERSGAGDEAILEFKRCLDLAPHREDAARAIRCLEVVRGSPLEFWASRPGGDRSGWVFTAYRPFFDLGPLPGGRNALMNFGPLIAYKNWHARRTGSHYPNTQRALPPAFRQSICEQSGLTQFDLWHPTQLPSELQTEAWAEMVSGLNRFGSLAPEERVLLCQLLMKLTLYEAVIFHLDAYAECPVRPSAAEAMLSYLYAFAEHMLFLGDTSGAYTPARLRLVAERAPTASRAAFAARSKMLVYHARFAPDAREATGWEARTRESLDALAYPSGSFLYSMWESRYHRAVAYVPFVRGDYEGALEHMRMALEFGERLTAETDEEELLKAENLYTVLESTTKTLLGAERLTEAHEATRRALQFDPWDSKTRLEFGNILYRSGAFEDAAVQYGWAAALGPPGTEVSAFLSGAAYEAAGDLESATHMYLMSQAADPCGISPAQRLAAMGTLPAARSFARRAVAVDFEE